VTVLFADVVHSMDIAAAVGAERLREIMSELVERSAKAVTRYEGTVDKFTGDGIMAVFGAPVALEDHAVRACLAALDLQERVKQLSADVHDRDGVDLQLRVGLNSGQVIAGEMGSGPFSYTTVGEQVGMAQRMESVSPPGGVVLSASTARLVEGSAALGDPGWVKIKGADEPVLTFNLLGMGQQRRGAVRDESVLVGRRWEMSAVEGLLDAAIDGRGAVVSLVGSPGIGKSRLTREVAAMADRRGAEVFHVFCESHTKQVPFHAVVGLLRAATAIDGLDAQEARAQIRAGAIDVDAEDLLMLDDLLGIGNPDAALPKIDPDARRRRLTAVVNAASLGREAPAVYVVEDAHWIDDVSESMLADFLAVIPQTPLLVLITYRPDYQGALARVPGAQVISLAPLRDAEIAALVTGLLGTDSSVGELRTTITTRSAGNPYFAEEIVRELAGRGVLRGTPGAYLSIADVTEVSVPATLQATIAARIDRLDPNAKRTLSAAAVVGSRFGLDLLTALEVEPVVADLVEARLIDQVRFTRQPEYVFHHPLIRAVAYESQLTSDRAELHRRLAAAIEGRGPTSGNENAALIAEHLEAAADLHAAFDWHMRAGAWAVNRDIAAAWMSWERARRVADAVTADDADRSAMRIAPRTMLCGIAFRLHLNAAGDRFDELRELCAVAGDKASLAVGMAGLVMDRAYQARMREASQLASEAWALIESIGDPALTVGLSFAPIYAKIENAEWSDVLRWSQIAIDLADHDPSMGNIIFGSPLAVAYTSRAIARYCMGRDGWRDDLLDALAMARSADPMSFTAVVAYTYFAAIPNGVLRPDDSAMRELEDALRIAERSGDDLALTLARMTLGVGLVHRDTDVDRGRGRDLLAQVGEELEQPGHNMCHRPIVEVYLAREMNRGADRDDAISVMCAAVDDLFRDGRLLAWGIPAISVLIETLLERSNDGDLDAAEAAVERLAAAAGDDGFVARDLWLLRLRALLARAHGDDVGYRDLKDGYRAMAASLGFEGHMQWAEEMA
jgi:class 3 adenylate cyclase